MGTVTTGVDVPMAPRYKKFLDVARTFADKGIVPTVQQLADRSGLAPITVTDYRNKILRDFPDLWPWHDRVQPRGKGPRANGRVSADAQDLGGEHVDGRRSDAREKSSRIDDALDLRADLDAQIEELEARKVVIDVMIGLRPDAAARLARWVGGRFDTESA